MRASVFKSGPVRLLRNASTPLLAATLWACATTPPAPSTDDADPYLWLEEIEGEKALSWVRAQNAATAERLESLPEFDELLAQAKSALDAPSRVPHVAARKGLLYNLWRDAEHPRGVYRRTTVASLSKAEPEWETVIDVDALSKAEGKKWVFKGMSCLPPEHTKCLVALSPGGGDAAELREFDASTKSFVEGGFYFPTAKQNVEWIDADTLFVASDFGEGSLTESGYARIVKRMKRGQSKAEAETLFEAKVEAVSARAQRYRTDEGDLDIVQEWLSYWESNFYHLTDDGLHRIELPKRMQIFGAFRGTLVVALKEPWSHGGKDFVSGTLVTVKPNGAAPPTIGIIAVPSEKEIILGARATKPGVIVEMLDAVRGRLYRYTPKDEGWERTPIAFPDNGSVHVETDDEDSGDLFVAYESFTTPPTLYHVPAATLEPKVVRQQSPAFDASQFTVAQHWATSKDGTKVPYFVVHAKDLEMNGKNPTHIFSYGGFRVPLTPSYSGSYEQLFGAYGKMWLERGGVFVLANIRGGGEFGPKWHEAALLENRPRAFEDFEAIAADLAKRKITSAKHLGIEGRSNGGLLVTATMHRRPELYGAIVCGVPLADMRRYHQLLAGASWMGEYGDPDKPEQWAFMSEYSPYQNLKADAGYPPVFFYTSTKDDRVHPGHARKMAARMIELGYDVTYYENLEGGHGGSSTNDQLAYRIALAYAHLWSRLR